MKVYQADEECALHWMVKAAKQGHAEAEALIKKLHGQISALEKENELKYFYDILAIEGYELN